MNDQQQAKQQIAELTAKLESLQSENARLKRTQQRIAEVNNNYLMLHYLTRNIQDCQTTGELWRAYLHNVGDCGFGYDRVALLLPDDDNNFTIQVRLSAGNDVQEVVQTTDSYILQSIATKTSTASADNLKAALPIVGKLDGIRAVLLVEKASGIFFEDLQLLDVYIRQTTAIIENTLLNEKMRNFQEVLGRQLDQFVMLHYVTKAIHDADNYYDVLENYLTTLCSPLGFGFQEGILYILAESNLQRAGLHQGKLEIVESAKSEGRFLDSVVAARRYKLSDEQRHLLLPLNSFGKITAVIEIKNDKEITTEQIRLLEIFAMQTASAIDNTRLKLHLEYMSYHDQLTQLYNRAYFEKEIQRIEREACYPVGLMVCDLDGLKMINDACGHAAGDYFIAAAAKQIKSIVPAGGTAARIGGDEFAIIISGNMAKTIEQIGLALTQAVDNYNAGLPVLPLGMSIGWAASTNQEKMIDIFKQADSNMYQDKYIHGQARREHILKTIAQYPGLKMGPEADT